MLGAPEALPATWYNTVKVTPEQAKAICEKHLTAVYLDWSGVPYNLAMRSGAKAVFSALGIKIVRFADYSFNPNGMAGVLTAILPLRPNILVTGGTVNAAQFAAIIKPAIRSGRHCDRMEPRLADDEDRPERAAQSHDHLRFLQSRSPDGRRDPRHGQSTHPYVMVPTFPSRPRRTCRTRGTSCTGRRSSVRRGAAATEKGEKGRSGGRPFISRMPRV